MVIGIDFDDTIATNAYPNTGELIPMAKEVINTLKDNGHYIFLWTVRGWESLDGDGSPLKNAQVFCDDNEIEIDNFNDSPWKVSTSPKVLADYFIDDIALGTPLMKYHDRMVVDWYEMSFLLEKVGAITKKQCDELINIAREMYPEIY
jgi:hypothetical protein